MFCPSATAGRNAVSPNGPLLPPLFTARDCTLVRGGVFMRHLCAFWLTENVRPQFMGWNARNIRKVIYALGWNLALCPACYG